RDLPDLADDVGRVVAADPHRRTRIELEQMDARHFGLELDFIVTAMRNIGPAWGEAGAPTAVLTSVTRPAAGARSEIGPCRPPGAPGCCCGGAVRRASS